MTTSINNVTVLGTGVLGSQIAYQTAYSGFEVTAYDISEEIVKTARERFEELAARYEREVEGARGGRAQAALARIKYSWSLADAVRDADLVIESAPERLDVKRELYTKLAPLAPEKNDLCHQQLHAAAERRSPTPRAGPTGSSRCTSPTRSGSTTSLRSWATQAPTQPSTTLWWSSRAGSAWSRSSCTKSNPAMS